MKRGPDPGAASWQYAAGIFSHRPANAIEGTRWPLPGTDQLTRQHLVNAQTALGRLYRAYLDAVQLKGYDGWFWREVLDPVVREAVGRHKVPPGQAMTE
mgnify:CR=1 FL=1